MRGKHTLGTLLAAYAGLGGNAFAFVGSDPLPMQLTGCSYTSASARLSAKGAIQYDVSGTCGNALISGKLAYDPSTKQFKERFFYQGSSELITSGTCAADPWATGAPCADQQVSIRGGLIDHRFAQESALAPVSRHAALGHEVLQRAASQAARPNPPAAPAGVQARTTIPAIYVQLRWLPPDESGNRPFVNFVVEARPANVAGAAWRSLGAVPRNTTGNYVAAFKLPPAVPGYPGWVVRACAATVFTSTCSPEVVPSTLIQSKQLERAPSMVAPEVVTGVKTQTPSDTMVSRRPVSVPPPKVTAPVGPTPAPSPARQVITTTPSAVSGRAATTTSPKP